MKDCLNALGGEFSEVLLVNHDYRGEKTGAQAGDGFEVELQVRGGLGIVDIQSAFYGIEYPVGSLKNFDKKYEVH